jgi:hypothetical protein
MKDYDLGSIEGGSSGMDAFFANEPEIVTPTKTASAPAPVQKTPRMKVGSLQQLVAFDRLNAETLVHRSTQDLWTIRKEADGDYYIERLFQDDGSPIKG